MNEQNHRLHEITESLENLPAKSRPSILRQIVIYGGGAWIEPGGEWQATHLIEITHLQISATAPDIHEATDNWIKTAKLFVETCEANQKGMQACA